MNIELTETETNMTKRISLSGAAAVAVVAIAYGLAVFVCMEPDVTKWTMDGRFGLALIGGMAASMSAAAVFIFSGAAA